MKDRMHEQMTADLKQGARTDTTVFIIAIILNLLFLGVNSGVASTVVENAYRSTPDGIHPINLAIFVTLLLLVVAIDVFVMRILNKGKERRAKLMAGLLKMYQEEGAEQYYDASLERGYDARYGLFNALIFALGLVAILVPILVSLP